MKSLILIATFVVSFSLTSLVVAGPNTVRSPIFELEPPQPTEPSQADLNEGLSDMICKHVGANAIVAQLRKNEGVPYEEAIAHFHGLVALNDNTEAPAQVAHAMSAGAIKAVYDSEIPVSTSDEMTNLGVVMYNQCRTIADQISWEIEVE